MNAMADGDSDTLRISADTKAVMNIVEYFRGGRPRALKAFKACDHDLMPKKKLIPGGILEPHPGKSFLFLGTNFDALVKSPILQHVVMPAEVGFQSF
jgi:hypothetical protein